MSSVSAAYFFYSAGILLREGFEALLVVVALAAVVKQLENNSALKGIYLGAGLAVLSSLVLAWAVGKFLTDNASDSLEGCFQLVAAVTLLYVSSWLSLKSSGQAWQAFLQTQAEKASRSSLPMLALGLTSFLAVMREGAETIVFFQALLAGADPGSERRAVAGGIVVASIGLILLTVILQGAASRLPIKRFFRVTSAMLYGLAVVFAGQGVASLQEAGIVHATKLSLIPTIKVLGLFPTLESVSCQLALILLALAVRVAYRSGLFSYGLLFNKAPAPKQQKV